MPVGDRLVAKIEGMLSVTEAKTPMQILEEMDPPKVTPRAIRLALQQLIAAGKAKRFGWPGQHYRVKAVVVEEPCHGPEDTTCPSCGMGAR